MLFRIAFARSTTLALSSALSSTLALAAPGEVHIVQSSGGPGVDFTTIESAVQAAQPGDILLLRDGSYGTPGSLLTLQPSGLSLVVDSGALLLEFADWEIADLPAGAWCVVQGNTRLCPSLRNCAGLPWIDAGIHVPGSVEQGETEPGVRVQASPAVNLTRCNIDGDWSQQGTSIGDATAALALQGSNVYCYGSAFEGGTYAGTTLAGNGGHGVELSVHSFMFALGSVFEGGDFLGGPSGIAGSALSLDAGTALSSIGSSFAGGGAVVGGTPGALKVGTGTWTFVGGPLFGMEATSPVREGQTCGVSVSGEFGAQAFLNLSAAPAALYLASLGATIQIDPSAVITIPLGAIPSSLSKTVHFTVPALATEGVVLFAQAHFLWNGELHLSGGQPLVLLAAGI